MKKINIEGKTIELPKRLLDRVGYLLTIPTSFPKRLSVRKLILRCFLLAFLVPGCSVEPNLAMGRRDFRVTIPPVEASCFFGTTDGLVAMKRVMENPAGEEDLERRKKKKLEKKMGQRIGKSRRQTLRPIERSKTPWSWSWSWGKWGRSCLDSTAGVVCLPLSYSSITKLEEKKRASQLSTILSFWKQWRGWENKVRVRVCWCPGCTYGRIEKRKEGKKEGGKEGRLNYFRPKNRDPLSSIHRLQLQEFL